MNKYIKLFVFILSLTVVLTFFGCSTSETETPKEIGRDERVLNAVNVLAEYWYDYYEKNNINDKYLEIVNTRIINIKENINSEEIYEKGDIFKDVDYIVEFDLISNYLDSSPYYTNVLQGNFVVVYKDGTTNVSNNLFNIYRSATFSTDFSPIIESIEDFHGEYDQVLELN